MRSISVVIPNYHAKRLFEKYFEHNLNISNEPGTHVQKAEAYSGFLKNVSGSSGKKNSFKRQLKRYDSDRGIIDVAQKHTSN